MKLGTSKGRPWYSLIRCGVPGIVLSATTVGLSLLPGCAAFESRPLPAGAADDGMVYYMPLRPIIVQVAFDKDGLMTITVPSASAIPDRSHPYLLTVPDSAFSEIHSTIQIGTNGLLQSAATVQTSGVEAFTKALATDLGTISGLAHGLHAVAAEAGVSCANSQTYSLVIWPETFVPGKGDTICGLRVTLEQLGGVSTLTSTAKAASSNAQSGIFYKTEIPYRVTVTAVGKTDGQAFIVYSPDQAPTQFLPLKKSFFASNTTTFTLTDGLLTKSESDVGGEITAVAVLPAEFISAYMAALGSIFSSLKTTAVDKTSLQACLAAIAANPIQGVSASQAATNYAAIKTACGGS